ncbi:hypothetical protein Bca52824_072109 [Brassica carinata]|uniref:Uncharacterized protein n=1 Tax=Brassica carinata TaxID=52824 RepID=A0A8X7QAE1_BRACI|nr:hypothetical protein Bca52824_072109 [Brassica carinata]
METHLFKWVDEIVTEEIEKVDAKHDELVNNVKDLRQSIMEHFDVQETRIDKIEEEVMRIKN